MTIDELKKVLLEGDWEKFKNCLETYNIDDYDKFGNNILHYYLKTKEAKKISTKKILNALINRGIDINQKQKDKQYGYSPMHFAVITKNIEAFDYLIEKGADINAQNINGNTILSSLVFYYKRDIDTYSEMINILLNKGADAHLKNNYGVSAYSLAHSIANSDVKKFFKQKGQTFFNPVKRFDGGKGDETPGAAHRNKDGVPIPTPHINHKNGEVRKPTEEEFPNNERFRKKNSYDK